MYILIGLQRGVLTWPKKLIELYMKADQFGVTVHYNTYNSFGSQYCKKFGVSCFPLIISIFL